MRRMISDTFIEKLVERIEYLENKVEELEARKNYDISLDENNKLIIDDLSDNEEA